MWRIDCEYFLHFLLSVTRKKILWMIFLLLFNHWVMSDSLVTPWTVAHQTPVHGIFPGKNTGVGCHFLLQGIFLTQGPYLHLLHYRWILYWLSHQGNPTSKTWKSCIKAILTIAFRNNVINLFCNKKQEEKHFIPCPVKSLARCSPITVVFYAFQWIPVIRGGKKKLLMSEYQLFHVWRAWDQCL